MSTAIGWKDSGALIKSTACGSDLNDSEKTIHHRGDVHFDFDEISLDAEHGCAKRLELSKGILGCSSIPEEGVSSTVLLASATFKMELDASDTAAGSGTATLVGVTLGQHRRP